MRRLNRTGGTSRTRRGCNAKEIKIEEDGFSLYSLKAKACVVRKTLSGVPGQPTMRDLKYPRDQAILQRSETCAYLVNFFVCQTQSLRSTNNTSNILCSSPSTTLL